MKELYIVLLIAIALGIFIACTRERSHDPEIEGFAETLGLAASQRNFYAKCVSDCDRSPQQLDGRKGTFAWNEMSCHDKCQDVVSRRVVAGAPDIKSPGQNPQCVHSEDPELCHCLADVKDYCKAVQCAYSKEAGVCQKACETFESYKCTSGMSWSWKP